MLSEQLKKILQLIKKTDDRVIIFDSNHPEDSFVLMGLDRYTKMLDAQELSQALKTEKNDLTEDSLTDKINFEISNWKNEDKEEELDEESGPGKTWKIPPKIVDKAEDIK